MRIETCPLRLAGCRIGIGLLGPGDLSLTWLAALGAGLQLDELHG